ncbi:MAG: response regulator transcription factor [Ignavibacteriae bacterium]|nr:response regulator transcription factor [Ignavibacteriota bacterium]
MALRILLADDHAGFRRTVSEFLARLPDINVVGEAADGREAVEQVEKLHPDMVLIDISMPNQNGLEATRIIKERWPATRVVIATTHDSPFYRNKANEAHADGYILKSSLKPDLVAAIQQANAQTFFK